MKKYLIITSLALFFAGTQLLQAQEKWTTLFNGKDFTGWKQLGGIATYKADKGEVVGITVHGTPNSFMVTEKEYGDFVLELEVKIPDTTTNSGIQFRSHNNPDANNGKGRVYGYQYELDASSRKWTGGIYDESRRGWLYPLDLNEAAKTGYKHGEYNKVRIEAKGNTIKTWINNIPASCIFDDADAKGFIALQVHGIGKPEEAGKEIRWRNIRIMEGNFKPTDFPASIYTASFINNKLSADEEKNGWKLLFDGKDNKAWRSAKSNNFPEKGWRLTDSVITVLSSKGEEATNGGDIVSKDLYGAFDLSFDFKLSTGANSGVKYFVTLSEVTTGSAIGLEYQVLDDENHPDAKMGINGNRTVSSLYDLITSKKDKRFIKPIGQWNKGRIVVYPNNHVEHYLNGIKVLEYERGSQTYRDLVAKSKYQKWANFGEAAEGHILLQDHGDEVSYRSIKIKVLK